MPAQFHEDGIRFLQAINFKDRSKVAIAAE